MDILGDVLLWVVIAFCQSGAVLVISTVSSLGSPNASLVVCMRSGMKNYTCS